MKILTTYLIGCLLFLNTAVFAGSNFEGTMNMQLIMAEAGKSKSAQNLTFYLKGPQGFVDIIDEAGTQQGSMIWNTEKDEIITLVNQNGQKMALKSTISMWRSISQTMSGMFSNFSYDEENDPFKWQQTSETKTINGVRCKKHLGTNSKYTMEAWVAEGVNMPKNAFGPFSDIFPAINDIQGFGSGMLAQSRLEAKDKSSVVELSNRLERKSVDDSKFQVPSGYPVMDITRMLQQLGNMDDKTSKEFLEQMFRGTR